MSRQARVNRYYIPTSGNQIEKIVTMAYMVYIDGINSAVIKRIAKQALQKHSTNLDFLESIFQIQIIYEEDKRVENQKTQAKFPLRSTIENYKFDYPHKIDKALIRELASCNFIDDGENVILVGPTGVGKTHLAVGLSKKAIDAGKKIKFFKLNDFIEKINKNTKNEASSQRNLIKSLINVDLLVLDDMEYSSQITFEVSTFLYNLFLGRYDKKKSTIFTSNESLSLWASVFGSQIRSEKVSDRLRERLHTTVIDGDSYRDRDKIKFNKQAAIPQIY